MNGWKGCIPFHFISMRTFCTFAELRLKGVEWSEGRKIEALSVC
jgi:hypothetical protein